MFWHCGMQGKDREVSPWFVADCSRQRAAKGKFQPKGQVLLLQKRGQLLPCSRSPGKCHCRE